MLILLIKQVLRLSAVLILAEALEQYLWMMLPALDLNILLVPVATYHHMIVDMGKMLVFDANPVSCTSTNNPLRHRIGDAI